MTYSKKISPPIYEPKGTCPNVETIVNDSKAKELLIQINNSGLTEEQKNFLIKASQRFLVFNYSLIAEYYCHQNSEMQQIMEKMALVIIDFNKAVENGYVTLKQEILHEYLKENE